MTRELIQAFWDGFKDSFRIAFDILQSLVFMVKALWTWGGRAMLWLKSIAGES